jgi:RHS repeat-associated protein
VLGEVALAPFGERYASSGNSGLTFAGISTWIEIDLDDAVFREYHPTQGRWLTPDPAGLAAVDPSNPQSWNRYGYVNNNPLSFVDPSGLIRTPWGAFPDLGFGEIWNEFDLLGFYWRYEGSDEQAYWFPALGLVNLFGGGSDDGSGNPANNVRSRLQQIANHLKNCGGVYPLTASIVGTFKVDSSLPSNIYAVTSQNDQLYSQTSINPNTFGSADPTTQTGVVVHEWFHTTQIDDNPFFTFMNGLLSQKLPSWLGGGFMENQANAAAKQALQTCGPG